MTKKLFKIALINNNYLFTGEQFDNNLGGYYLRARYFDQTTGRFVSRYPFEGFNDWPVTLHDYLYAINNPSNFIDPSGEAILTNYSRESSAVVDLLLGGVQDLVLSQYTDQIIQDGINALPDSIQDDAALLYLAASLFQIYRGFSLQILPGLGLFSASLSLFIFTSGFFYILAGSFNASNALNLFPE